MASKPLKLIVGSAFLALSLATPVFGQNVTKDKLHGYIGLLEGAAVFSPSSQSHTGTAADHAIDFGTSGGQTLIWITNAAFLNIAATNDQMSFSIWIRHYDVATACSAFWANSTSAGGNRGWQAHVPWSDDVIYFDTAGCCGANTRISAPISSFGSYTDDTWWTTWHHFVFEKNAGTKDIYIDGQLFLEGTGADPLPTDFTDMYLGAIAPNNSNLHGLIDDFAVYATALTAAQIGQLFAGTAPDALGASAQLLAYWDFNDAPAIALGAPVGSPVGFAINVTDLGATVSDTNTVVLTLNGTNITPTSVTKSGIVATIAYTNLANPFPAGSSQVTVLTIKDKSGDLFSATNSFAVPAYSIVTPGMALAPASVDTTRPGFKIRTYQVDNTATGNGIQVAEDILSGVYGPNVANLNDAGGADTNGFFSWPGLVNFDINTTAQDGSFNDPAYTDSPFPGIPGNTVTAVPTEHFACELFAALDFTAPGLYQMVCNSDDDFATFTGTNPSDAFLGLTLGEYGSTGGRGSADTAFLFIIQQAGLYGFRTVYEQGTGGANLEWFMINPDGTRVLINDVTNAIQAYQWLPKITAAYVRSVSPAAGSTTGDPTLVQAAIVDGLNPVLASSVSLKVDGAAVAATVTKAGAVTTVSYVPAPFFASQSAHTAALLFTDGTNQVTRQWQFTVSTYSKDKVNGDMGFLQLDAAYTANGGGHSGKTGDYAVSLPLTGGDIYVPQAGSFLNALAPNDQVTFSIWVKKIDNANCSAFWANTTNANAGGRGIQAHTPWDTGNGVYFDTMGCCGGNTRITATVSATTLPSYTGPGWWNSWHHFAFTKSADYKVIWIDGQFFVDGSGADPLTPEFTDMYIGAQSISLNTLHGWIDDFAVFATALGTNDVMALANGTAPTALAPATQLVAYWDFNDAPAPAQRPSITIGKAGGKLTITYTGVLQSAATANGTYADVQGASSPYNVDITKAAQQFYRSRQ